jgi:hypothetical protein
VESAYCKKPQYFNWDFCLFLRFFVQGVFPAPPAVALEFELPLDHLFVFAGHVVHPLAGAAAETNYFLGKFTLCHSVRILHDNTKNAIPGPLAGISLLGLRPVLSNPSV